MSDYRTKEKADSPVSGVRWTPPESQHRTSSRTPRNDSKLILRLVAQINFRPSRACGIFCRRNRRCGIAWNRRRAKFSGRTGTAKSACRFSSRQSYSRGRLGLDTDIVSKEMYTFEDRDESSISLRPEATASVVRAYIEHGMQIGGRGT